MNKVFLIGNLTADPVLSQTSTGNSVTSFSIAISEWQGQGKNPKTIFLPCRTWNKIADYVGKYLKKGNLVELEGKLDRRSFVNKNGINVYVTEIIVERIKNIISKKKSNEENLSNDNWFETLKEVENEEKNNETK